MAILRRILFFVLITSICPLVANAAEKNSIELKSSKAFDDQTMSMNSNLLQSACDNKPNTVMNQTPASNNALSNNTLAPTPPSTLNYGATPSIAANTPPATAATATTPPPISGNASTPGILLDSNQPKDSNSGWHW